MDTSIAFRVSDDFLKPRMIETTCKSLSSRDLNSYTIDVEDRWKNGDEDYSDICEVSSLFGYVSVHDSNDFASDISTNVFRNRSLKIVLSPQIITTDENLRSLNPKK
jgi:hypothetical protein